MPGERLSCPVSHIRRGWKGFPEFLVFSVPRITQPGEEAVVCLTGEHRFPLTYVFVHELALVPVVQVDELGRALLLPVHPGAHVLAAGLGVDVGALAVPA